MLEITTVLSGTGVVGGGVNRLYWGGTSGSDAEAAAFAVNEFWDALNGAMTNEVTFTIQNVANVIDPATGDILAAIGPITTYDAIQGTDGTHTLPLASQGLIHLHTGVYLGGREVRGRIFLPCFGEDQSEAGKPNAGALGTMQAAFDAMMEATIGLKVWSRTHGSEHAVIAGNVSTKWAVLRSRRD
jgi:hypothetical protein